jgi:hypothetical protein
MVSDEASWLQARQKAEAENPWFIPEFTDTAIRNIASDYLDENKLLQWVKKYQLPHENTNPKSVGIVMAGNIPLVGFHDFLCVFISGHRAVIKTSSKDNTLLRKLVEKLHEWEPETKQLIRFEDMLKGCDAYIATGSHTSSVYFRHYFGKYPHIIRRNKTAVAVLSGNESAEDLENLADDVFLYFGMGCRNVTRMYVPENYEFPNLLQAFQKYSHLAYHHRYKNNYDYNLTLHILNKKYYMTNGVILLSENDSLFSPISQLNFEYYRDSEKLVAGLSSHPDVQCIVGGGHLPFGKSQNPAIDDYADGVDTLEFLTALSERQVNN